MSESLFSASGSMTGYFYQSRLAMVETLRRLQMDLSGTVSIEGLDDITFQDSGHAIELLQSKHHAKVGSLSDVSVDLWKTLRVWLTDYSNGNDETISKRILITTSVTPADSAASFLCDEGNRDIDKAASLLRYAAETSTNKLNEDGYRAFLSLENHEITSILESIVVMPGSPDMIDIEEELKRLLRLSCAADHLEDFIDDLEGWWFNKMVIILTKRRADLSLSEVRVKIDELRERYVRDYLPLYDDIADLEDFDNYTFAKQLQLIGVSKRRVSIAARNFIRAAEHRSRWTRKFLLGEDELTEYDDTLKEEWQIRFEQMIDELGGDTDQSVLNSAGKKLYKWFESDAKIPLRTV